MLNQLPHIDDFLLHIQTHNYSPETLYNYERDLQVFEKFLSNDVSVSFDDVNKIIIERFKAFLVSNDRRTSTGQKTSLRLSTGSINRTLSSLRSYLRYLVEMDYPTPIAPDVVRLLKLERKHPRVAEFNQLVALIESPSAFEKDNRVALRNRVMLEVLFATGMRISELLSLDRNQIDTTGKIFIRGKGKKERFVYLTKRAMEWVQQYIAKRNDSNPALFIPYRGANVLSKKSRVSHNYLQMKIKQYRERLGINVPTSAHSLRHGFATYLAESGANPAAIQILLGHESLETTTRYVHASDKYAEKTHREFHPLKK